MNLLGIWRFFLPRLNSMNKIQYVLYTAYILYVHFETKGVSSIEHIIFKDRFLADLKLFLSCIHTRSYTVR